MEIDIDKKWKYLHFLKDDGRDGWRLGLSDKSPGVPRDKLFSTSAVQQKIRYDETFRLVFNAIASDPQLVECADGLHEATVSLGLWKIVPVYFNRRVYQWFSNYVRSRKRLEDSDLPVESTDIEWMNLPQLKVARRLLIDLFSIQDASEIDRLIAFKQENPAA
jgi:hypothetical protein